MTFGFRASGLLKSVISREQLAFGLGWFERLGPISLLSVGELSALLLNRDFRKKRLSERLIDTTN
jgi:hypothetical protein